MNYFAKRTPLKCSFWRVKKSATGKSVRVAYFFGRILGSGSFHCRHALIAVCVFKFLGDSSVVYNRQWSWLPRVERLAVIGKQRLLRRQEQGVRRGELHVVLEPLSVAINHGRRPIQQTMQLDRVWRDIHAHHHLQVSGTNHDYTTSESGSRIEGGHLRVLPPLFTRVGRRFFTVLCEAARRADLTGVVPQNPGRCDIREWSTGVHFFFLLFDSYPRNQNARQPHPPWGAAGSVHRMIAIASAFDGVFFLFGLLVLIKVYLLR